MLLDNGTFIAAVNHVSTSQPGPGRLPHPNYAADATQAALEHGGVKPRDIGMIHHFADLPIVEGTSPALDLLLAADLPASCHPVVTLANGGAKGVLDALTIGACYLDRIGATASCSLIAAGDAWPIEGAPPSASREDAGGALILSVEHGGLELVATATARHPELVQALQTGNARSISEGTAALVDAVVTEALHDAEVLRDDVTTIITAFAPSSDAHRTLARQADPRPWHPPTVTDGYRCPPRASAVNLLGQLAAYLHEPVSRELHTPILVVADNNLGSATAAVLRVA